jgi:hypothetical protein
MKSIAYGVDAAEALAKAAEEDLSMFPVDACSLDDDA